jgi:hypothetical protein
MSSTSNLSYSRYLSCRNLYMLSMKIQVVSKVENTLFQVLRNGFNVPGTTFEAMFALPQTPADIDCISLEGSNLENPIHLMGIKANHFRSFLRILYPLCVQIVFSILVFVSNKISSRTLQYRPHTYRRIWWVGWSSQSSNHVVFPRG